MGPRTREAEAAARASQKAKGLPFVHVTGLTRVHWHWTGGVHEPNSTDRRHYHILIAGTGTVHRIVAPETPRSHTSNANRGAVGLSVCAMAGAAERPFKPGDYPITEAQLDALAAETALLCRRFNIPVSRFSTLSHAEIQPTLGIRQKQKWDINWLPGMKAPGDPITVGDKIRALVAAKMR